MPRSLTVSDTYDIAGIGPVAITVRRNARSMRLRWKGPTLALTVPYGQDYARAVAFVQSSSDFIESHRRPPLYSIGQRIETAELLIEIKSTPRLSQTVRAIFPEVRHALVYVADDVDIASAPAIKSIDSVLRRIAARYAPDILLPQARDIADSLGVRPASWAISRGVRTLGLCTARGEIKLSSLLVLYPPRLRRYVICHELAHLTHMDHSPAFHALCDAYYGAKGSAARAELKAAAPPLIR